MCNSISSHINNEHENPGRTVGHSATSEFLNSQPFKESDLTLSKPFTGFFFGKQIVFA